MHQQVSSVQRVLTRCHDYEMNTSHQLTSITAFQSRDATSVSTYVWTQSVVPISEEIQKVMTIFTRVCFIPFAMLGVPGNIVSAVVFYRQGLRERINLCLFALAIVDLVVILVFFFPALEDLIRTFFLSRVWFFSVNFPGLTGFDRASQFLSAVIASERCFCVVSPFHAKRLLKTSTMAAIIVVCCLILVGGMCAIAGPKHTVIEVLNPATNTTIDKFYFTRYYLDNKDILDFFDIYLYATCLPAIFLLVITVTTVVTVISLRSAVFRRQSMTRAKVTRQDNVQSAVSVSSKEIAVTRMLVGTSVVFVICVFPHMVFQVTSLIVVDLRLSGKYYNIVLVTWYFIGVFRVIRCSLNICVYCALGSKFRQTLKEMCCYCGDINKEKIYSNTHMYE